MRSPDAEHLVLGGRLKRRARAADVHAFLQFDSVALGNFVRARNQLAVVGLAHIGEARAQFVVVVAAQRILGEVVDLRLNWPVIKRRQSICAFSFR